MKKISSKLIIKLTIILLVAVLAFHFLVLFQVIPYQFVWGGRLQDLKQMRIFELFSIFVNGILIGILAIKGSYVRQIISIRIVDGILWLFTFLFAINTVGNLFAKMSLETVVFTPLTFILAILCYIILKNDGTDYK